MRVNAIKQLQYKIFSFILVIFSCANVFTNFTYKTTDRIFTKILQHMCIGTRQK